MNGIQVLDIYIYKHSLHPFSSLFAGPSPSYGIKGMHSCLTPRGVGTNTHCTPFLAFLQVQFCSKEITNNTSPTSLASSPNFYWGPNTTQASRQAGCKGSTPHFYQAPQIHAKPWETRHEPLKYVGQQRERDTTIWRWSLNFLRFSHSFHSFLKKGFGRAGPLSPSYGIKGMHSCLTPRGVGTNTHCTPFLAFLQVQLCSKEITNNTSPTSLASSPNFYWGPNTTQASRQAGCKGSTPHFYQAPQIHAKPWETRHGPLKYVGQQRERDTTIWRWSLNFLRFSHSFHSFHVPPFCAIAQAQVRVNLKNWCKPAKMAWEVAGKSVNRLT